MTPHEALKAAIEERMRLAREATPGPWRWGPLDMTLSGKLALMGPGMTPVVKAAQSDVWPQASDARFIAANDPAFVIRQCERDLKVLERHAPCVDCDPATVDWRHEPFCHRCAQDSPCVPIRDLAEVYQINLGVSDES